MIIKEKEARQTREGTQNFSKSDISNQMFLCFSMYHQSVPKPWTGSSSTASWAPIRAPTTTSTRQESSAAASSSTGEEAHTEEKKLSGARNGTSLPNESSSKSDLEQAIQDLDSCMPVEDSVTVMQEENNNEASEARTKMTAAQVQEVDDLTRQLMEALDTNEVIDTTAKQSPFGKSKST